MIGLFISWFGYFKADDWLFGEMGWATCNFNDTRSSVRVCRRQVAPISVSMEGYFRGIPGFLKSTHRLLGRNVDRSCSALCLPKQAVSGISLLISTVLFVPVSVLLGYHCHIFHVVRGQIEKGD